MRYLPFCKCENKDADQLRSNTAHVISAFVFAIRTVPSLFYLNPKFQALAIFCGCTARFVSDLVGNPEDRVSQNEAHLAADTFQTVETPAIIFFFKLHYENMSMF